MNKNEPLEKLNATIATQINHSDKRRRLDGRNNLKLANCIAHATLETYNKIAFTKNGNVNQGYIMEEILLDWANLQAETPEFEIKFFGNNPPNILINKDTKVVYLVIAKATNYNAYIIRDAQRIANQRLSLKHLQEMNLLNEICEPLAEYLGL